MKKPTHKRIRSSLFVMLFGGLAAGACTIEDGFLRDEPTGDGDGDGDAGDGDGDAGDGDGDVGDGDGDIVGDGDGDMGLGGGGASGDGDGDVGGDGDGDIVGDGDGDIVIEPGCGDGVVEMPEECDDENNESGDGCHADCRLEIDQISVGWFYMCALFSDGSLKCIGDKANLSWTGGVGQELPIDSVFGNSVPFVDLGDHAPIKKIVSGAGTCALFEDGRAKCWGGNLNWISSPGTPQIHGDLPDEMGDNLPFLVPGPGRTIVDIDIRNHACALLDNGDVRCWGVAEQQALGYDNPNTPYGDEAGETLASAPRVPLSEPATQMVAGLHGGCALLDTNKIECWGKNTSGQLGFGATDPSGPVEVDLGSDYEAEALYDVERETYCARLVGGDVVCWGALAGNDEHIGDEAGEMGANLVPLALEAGTQQVKAGEGAVCALSASGEVTCSGNDSWGATGGVVQRNVPGSWPNKIPLDFGHGRTVTDFQTVAAKVCVVLDHVDVKCVGGVGVMGLGNRTTGRMPADLGTNLPFLPFRDRHCGDGTVDPWEVCDDGNHVSWDGCDADCSGDTHRLEPAYLWEASGNAEATIPMDGFDLEAYYGGGSLGYAAGVDGSPNSAFELFGNYSIRTPDGSTISEIDGTDDFSFSIWINSDHAAAEYGPSSYTNLMKANPSAVFILKEVGLVWEMTCGESAQTIQADGIGFPEAGTWYHLVGTVQPGKRTANLIINGGQYISTQVIECDFVYAPWTTHDLKFGDGSILYDGRFDHAAIFPFALDVTGAKAWMDSAL